MSDKSTQAWECNCASGRGSDHCPIHAAKAWDGVPTTHPAAPSAQPSDAADADARIEKVMQYLHPYLDTSSVDAPAWAIHVASFLTGGDGCFATPPTAQRHDEGKWKHAMARQLIRMADNITEYSAEQMAEKMRQAAYCITTLFSVSNALRDALKKQEQAHGAGAAVEAVAHVVGFARGLPDLEWVNTNPLSKGDRLYIHPPQQRSEQGDWRIAFFERQQKWAQELGYAGIADALDALSKRDDGASVTDAARALVAKLRLIHDDPDYQSVWVLASNRGMPYTGPKYDAELAALEAALHPEQAKDGETG